MNRLMYLDELRNEVTEANPGSNWERIRDLCAQTQAEQLAPFPLYLGYPEAINYMDKTDRYVFKHANGTAKTTSDVAAFLLTHAFNRTARPVCYGTMEDGTIVGVTLLFLSRV